MLNDRPELGDRVEQALKLVGIDKELMRRIVGKDCKCDDRQQMLNHLDRWARRVLKGKTAKAKEYLERML
jgi:SOS response regulatory protein OraA/RecX